MYFLHPRYTLLEQSFKKCEVVMLMQLLIPITITVIEIHSSKTKKSENTVNNNNIDMLKMNLWWNNNTWINVKLGITITHSSWILDEQLGWTIKNNCKILHEPFNNFFLKPCASKTSPKRCTFLGFKNKDNDWCI